MDEKPLSSNKPKTAQPHQRGQTEASLESMDASDPPAYSATLSGAAQASQSGAEAREQKIRRRAYELWEQDGRPSGRADDYWHRAERELAAESADKS